MKNLNNQTQIEVAMQMVIIDAIENGHTNKLELIDYMKSEVFESAVSRYMSMINEG